MEDECAVVVGGLPLVNAASPQQQSVQSSRRIVTVKVFSRQLDADATCQRSFYLDMGNTQSEGKKRGKKSKDLASEHGKSEEKLDRDVKKPKDVKNKPAVVQQNESEGQKTAKPTAEKINTPAKRAAPRPPRTVERSSVSDGKDNEDHVSRDSSDNANRAEVVEKEEKSELRITLESPPATTACVEAASPVEESETPASLESIGVQPRSSVELLDSLLITDSWRLANKRSAPLDIPTPPSKDSSSDSVFTDPDEHPVSSTVTKDRRKTMAPPIPITTHKKVQLASPSQLVSPGTVFPRGMSPRSPRDEVNNSLVLNRVSSYTNLARRSIGDTKGQHLRSSSPSPLRKFDASHFNNWLETEIKDQFGDKQLNDDGLKRLGSAICEYLMGLGVLRLMFDEPAKDTKKYNASEIYCWAYRDHRREAASPTIERTWSDMQISEIRGELVREIDKLKDENTKLRNLENAKEGRKTAEASTQTDEKYEKVSRASSPCTVNSDSGRFTSSYLDISPISSMKGHSQGETHMETAVTHLSNVEISTDGLYTTARGDLPKKRLFVGEETSRGESSSEIVRPSAAPPPPPPMPDLPAAVGIPPPPPLPDLPVPAPRLSSSSVPAPPPPPMPPDVQISAPPMPPPMPSASGIPPPPPPPPMMSGIPPPPPPPPMMSGIPPPPPPPMMGLGSKPGVPVPPPPMLGGPVPPAPPMAGGFVPTPLPAPPPMLAKPTLRKEALNPEIPMKPLYWTRILVPVTEAPPPELDSPESPPQVPLWAQLEEVQDLNMKEFADLFGRQVTAPKIVKKVENGDKPSKVESAKILDPNRSKMVGILEKSLHVDFTLVERALYDLDTNVVNLEALRQIYEVRASPKELEDIAAHEAACPDVPLDRPELFLKRLSSIKHFSERIACLVFQSEFHDAIFLVSSKLTNLSTTSDYLQNSQSLKKVIALILTLGNYMNGGNRVRGQADGFGLEILGKLKDVKSKVPGVTLLHYLVKARLAQEPEINLEEFLPLPITEPADIQAAASVNFDDLQRELDKLDRDLKACRHKLKIIINDDVTFSKPFHEKMTRFLARADEEIKTEVENLQEARAKFISVMQFYQYKPKGKTVETADPQDFFVLWLEFCQDFKNIWKKEQERIRKEKLEMERRKAPKYKSRHVVTVKKSENGFKAKMQRLQKALAAKNKK